MHKIFEKLIGRNASPLARWRTHRTAVEQRIAPWQAPFIAAVEHAEVIATRNKNFVADPTPENLAMWKQAIAERQAAHEVGQQLIGIVGEKRKEFFAEGRPILADVIEEAADEIKARLAKIRASDEKASQEFGEAFVSEQPLTSLENKLGLLERARKLLDRDVGAAAALVSEAAGEEI